MLGVFYKFCCCEAQTASEITDKDGDKDAAKVEVTKVQDSKEEEDQSLGEEHAEETVAAPVTESAMAAECQSDTDSCRRKDSKHKTEKRNFFIKRESNKKSNARHDKSISVMDRIKVFEKKPPEPSDVKLRDGTKPKKKKVPTASLR